MKRVVLFMVVLMPLVLAAQPRTDQNKPVKIERASQLMSNPVGWAFDTEHQKWSGYYGLIWPHYRNNNNKTPIWSSLWERSDWNELTTFPFVNIISMQVKKTKIDTIPAYLLYVQFWTYYYDYPTLEVGRHDVKETDIFIMTADEYAKLWSLDTNITIVQMSYAGTFASHYFDCKSERCVLEDMNDPSLLKGKPNYLYVKKENGNTVRFFGPTELTFVENRIGDNVDFSKRYFEVSTATFNKLKIQ